MVAAIHGEGRLGSHLAVRERQVERCEPVLVHLIHVAPRLR